MDEQCHSWPPTMRPGSQVLVIGPRDCKVNDFIVEHQRAAVTLLRALIVEDEWPARSYLVELLQQTAQADVVAAVATVTEQALDPAAGTKIDAAAWAAKAASVTAVSVLLAFL